MQYVSSLALFRSPSVMHHDSHTGLVLAGGRSLRFGSDKSVAEVEGRRMVDRVVAALRPLVAEVLISVGADDDAPSDVEGRVVVDRIPGRGPLGGLQAGLAAAETPWILAAACDMPFLTTDALESLVRRCSPGVRAVVAVTGDGRKHPLCACYQRAVLDVVNAQLETADWSMRRLLEQLDVAFISLPASVVRNVNRPGDLS